jgi:hypothetical protein
VQVNVKTNALEVAKNIGKGTDEIMKMLPDALKDYVIEVIKELLNKSYPAPGNDPSSGGGNSTEAVEQGKSNIEAEINRAFTTWDNTKVGDLIMAKNEAVLWNLNNPIPWRNPRLARAWQNKDLDTLYRAFKAAGWEEGKDNTNFEQEPTTGIHNRLRDPNSGRILDAVRNNKQLRISVRDRQAIEAYILTKQKSIGTMAGGWVKALTALGYNANSPFGGNGQGGATISNKGLTIKAYNSLGDYNGMISEHGIIEAVVREKGEGLKSKLDAEIDRLLKANATK